MSPPNVAILENLEQRLSKIQSTCIAGLYGVICDRKIILVGLSVKNENWINECRTGNFFRLFQLHLPTGIDFCGILSVTDDLDVQNTNGTLKELENVIVTDNPILIRQSLKTNEMIVSLLINERLCNVGYEKMSEADFYDMFITIRVQSSLPMPYFAESISIEKLKVCLENIFRKTTNGCFTFVVKDTDNYIFSERNEQKCRSIQEILNSVKLAKDYKFDKGVLEVQLLEQLTCNFDRSVDITAPVMEFLNDDEKFSPAIFKKRISECSDNIINIKNIPIDVLCISQKTRNLQDIYGLLVDAICRSLIFLETSIQEMIDFDIGVSKIAIYHYFPSVIGHILTYVYPEETDDKLHKIRKQAHDQQIIPLTDPVFRKGNSLNLETINRPYLMNIHVSLKPPGSEESNIHLVKGNYTYYHYMHHNFNDNGWGCAYRSLQTIFSWYQHQGYTDKELPSHTEIQKCLVDIGDKPKSFTGSKQWIGSSEVMFYLNSIDVVSRILRVAENETLNSIAVELANHFDVQGTPVMIGGGVLAHTILGIYLNEDTYEVKYLVLDPHYTGDDNLKIIQNKGWVGWKPAEFWKKGSFYNLCLPQRIRTF